MKTLLKTAIVTGLLITACCRSYQIPSPATFVLVSEAVLTEAGEEVATVDLSPIKAAISNSTWLSGRLLDKGSFHMKINDSLDMHVSFHGEYFWIEGQHGYYRVRESDSEIIVRYYSKLEEEILIPWREQRNNRTEQDAP